MSENKKKQSIIYGALTGTAGIFFTKALGLLYASPFQALAGRELVFYSYTYQIYNFVLELSLSGIPFAIAALVAKYAAQKDYRTILGIRKISMFMLASIGIICFALIVLNSGALVRGLTHGMSDPVYLGKYQNCLIIMAFALVAVPIQGAFRGFYQGLKELKIYAFSQILEQLIRVTFLLAMGFLAVYVFRQERIWAVYFAVASMSVSAFGTTVFFLKVDHERLPEIRKDAQSQPEGGKDSGEIVREIVYLAVPFLLVSVIDNLSGLINVYFVPHSLTQYGYLTEYADRIYSIMSFSANKLTSIPQIVGPGFALAIIPHLTTSLTLNDFKGLQKNIWKVYASAGYLAAPLITMMIAYAAEIYFVMYGNSSLELAKDLFTWGLVVTIFWLMIYLTSQIMLTLKLRGWTVILTSIDAVISLCLTGWVVSRYSYPGLYVMTIIQYSLFVAAEWLIIRRHFPIRFGQVIRILSGEIVCCLAIVLIAWLFSLIPVRPIELGRVFTFFYVGAECLIELGAYAALTYWLRLPQAIFQISLADLKARLTRRHAAG